MKRHVHITILFILLLAFVHANAQKVKLVNSENYNPAPFVHALSDKGKVYVSDLNGILNIPLSETGKLKLTSVGFKEQMIDLAQLRTFYKENFFISIEPSTIMLGTVTVNTNKIDPKTLEAMAPENNIVELPVLNLENAEMAYYNYDKLPMDQQKLIEGNYTGKGMFDIGNFFYWAIGRKSIP